MDYVNETFTNRRVDLSKNSFKKCVFNHCLLVFDGTGATDLDDCDPTDSQFAFDGYAGTTLLFLTDIYKNGGAHVVEEIFTHIREGRYTYGDAIKSKGVN